MSLRLLASGSNAFGQLANGNTIDAHKFVPCLFADRVEGVNTLSTESGHVLDVACGANHTLVLFERHGDVGGGVTELWGCGDDSKGQLSCSGGSIFKRIDLPLRDYDLGEYTCRLIAVSWETSYVVLSRPRKNDVVVSMGAGDFGNLGASAKRPGSLHLVSFAEILPPATASFVVGFIAAGPRHIIVRLQCTMADQSTCNLLVGWGNSRHGQLGKGTTSFLEHPGIVLLDEREDLLDTFRLGTQHSVFLRTSGGVLGIGSDRKGQLRGIDGVIGVKALGCTWNGTYLVVESGSESDYCIMATGSHIKGQLGRSLLPSSSLAEHVCPAPVQFPFTSSTHHLKKIACGSEHVVCLFDVPSYNGGESETEVWGWGWNEHGNLGNGTTDDVLLPQKIWPGAGERIHRSTAVNVWAGCGTTWIAINERST